MVTILITANKRWIGTVALRGKRHLRKENGSEVKELTRTGISVYTPFIEGIDRSGGEWGFLLRPYFY